MVKKILVIISAVVIIFFAALLILTSTFPKSVAYGDKIAVIKIEGTITNAPSSIIPIQSAAPSDVIDFLEQADEDPSIKAILLRINSPGGTPVASSEIAAKVKSINKTTVAWISDVGASGAYWIASSADKVVAHPLSITCSVGAFTVVSDFSELFDEYGLNFTVIKSGEYKDIGSPYKSLDSGERKILQDMVDTIRGEFVQGVKENRNLTDEQIAVFSDGRPCLGKDALEYGLVDSIGSEEDAVTLIMDIAGLKKKKLVTLEKSENLFGNIFTSSLYNAFYYLGQGIGENLRVLQLNEDVKISS